MRYISLAGQTVATHSSDGHFTYLIPDRQGTGTLAVDSQTQAVTRRQYKPFGEQRDQTGTWSAGQRGYVGGTQDDNTGLTNLGAREYDPSIGRFLAPDPLLDTGDPQSWNAYDYADDTPVTSSDPSGLCMADQCGVGYPIGGTGSSPSNPKRYVDTGPVDPMGSSAGGNQAYCHHGSCTDGHRLGAGGGVNGGNISPKTYDRQAESRALARAKATAQASTAAAKKQASGLKQHLVNLVADVIGLTDAYNCFTKGDVMGCINTALTSVPWGKVFKAIKVGVEAFKVWKALDRAYTAVKDAEEAEKVVDGMLDAERALDEIREAESAGTSAASCAVHSFVAGTPVRLADGSSTPISQIKTGDTVLATDPQTGVTTPEKVQRLIVTHTDRDFTTLTLDTTPVRGPPQSETLTTTWHHPFWDTTHHRWTDAHDLTPGTHLRGPAGTTVTVKTVHNFHHQHKTYDLTVGVLHTYYVLAGATPVLVHNCDVTYVTYTKTNPSTGQVYTGRSRGVGTPQQIVSARDSDHHMTEKGFGPAVLDKHVDATLPIEQRHSDPAYQAMRGREQQLIDHFGGARSDGGTSGNAIRGVAADNPMLGVFLNAASRKFGSP
ncbi:RHS repeat-associated core domain-containing protein [Streptomyces achromogenes]|uniref:RHS repeat-associated core domain-containing protein n=1 Tax=Streptomyces achromogenes TaxID=67255 RepID=UPI00371C4F89